METTTDPEREAMLAGMEQLVAAMRDRKPAPPDRGISGDASMGSESASEAGKDPLGVAHGDPFEREFAAGEPDRDQSPRSPCEPEGSADTLPGDTQMALRRAAAWPWSALERATSQPPEEIRIGRYLVHGTLGQGGMGRVLRAYDETLGREVALKVLLDAHGRQHGRRLLREAQALARLSHLNVVRVYDVGEIEGRLCMAMELVQGTPLDRWQREPRSWRAALQVYLQAGRGLAAAHAEGLVHRDFKPANCILDELGVVKVLDFGLARGVAGSDRHSERAADEDDPSHGAGGVGEREAVAAGLLEQQLTRTGTLLGTLAYMAPEQLLGTPADARSDQFSFCVSLFEALFGKRPFSGSSLLGQLQEIQQQRMHPSTARNGQAPVPRWLLEALRRGLQVAGDRRWPSMNALLAVLERGLERRRIVRRVAMSAMLMVGVGGGLYGSGVWREESPCEGLRDEAMPAWTANDRRAVGEAIASSGLPNAARAQELALTKLDAYATAWVDANVDACEATWVRRDMGEQALLRRKACLDERVAYVRAAVQELASADARTAALAPDVVERLPELAVCDDVEALLAGPTPVPETLASQATEVRALIARSWATSATGHDARGVEAADRAAAMAEGLPDAPVLRLEALLNRGEVLRMARRWPEARRDLEAALELAERLQGSAQALDVLTQLVLLANDEDDVSAANTALAAIRGKLTRLEHQPRRVAQRWWLEGAVAYRARRNDDALAAAGRAVAEYERLEDPVDEERFEALVVVGDARIRRNDLAGAREAFQLALALAEAGARLPAIARALSGLGYIDYVEGRMDEARATLERVLELREAFYGEQAVPNIRTRHLLAIVLQRQGQLALALEQAMLAQRSLDEHVPPQLRGQVFELLGGLHRANSEWVAAIASYREARSAWSSVPRPDRLALAGLDSNVADCLTAMGELDLAPPLYDAALAVYEAETEADDPRRVTSLLGRGKLRLARGEQATGVADLRLALALERPLAQNPLLRAELRWVLGQALRAGTDVDPQVMKDAAADVRDARRVFADAGFRERAEEVDAWLSSCGTKCMDDG